MLAFTRIVTVYLNVCPLLVTVSSANKKPPAEPVNINSGNSAQLQLVPGIGPSTAEKNPANAQILRRL